MSTSKSGLTLTVLGCGALSTAIVSGILSSLNDVAPQAQAPSAPTEGLVRGAPSHFVACVTSPASAKRVQAALGHLTDKLTVLVNENVRAVRESDVVLLGCKPYNFSIALQEHGMREALQGKLLISIIAGVSVQQLEQTIYGATDISQVGKSGPGDRCTIVRVMPNTAALVRQSMTVIATSTPPLPSDLSALVDWMFTRVGRIVHLPPHLMDACTALCGSGPATFLLILEAMADGAVAMGLPRAEAQLMATQTMKGASELVLNGEHPTILRERVCTPGGCTIGGLLVLEEGAVRGTVARSVREATVVAAQLGKGVQGVNGTRKM